MDREELVKRLEVTNDLLEQLDTVLKMLKKGTGPLGGTVITENYVDKINAQIRQLKVPFKKYGRSEISDSKSETVIRSKEIVFLKESPFDPMTRGAYYNNRVLTKEDILTILSVYESFVNRAEIIRDELIKLKDQAETSGN